MEPPSVQFFNDILTNIYLKINQESLTKFCDFLYKTLKNYSNSLNDYLYVAENVLDSLDINSKSQNSIKVHSISTNDTSFFKNKELSEKCIQFTQNIYHHKTNESEKFTLQNKGNNSTLGLNFLQAILVVSGYVASVNPKKTDLTLFSTHHKLLFT